MLQPEVMKEVALLWAEAKKSTLPPSAPSRSGAEIDALSQDIHSLRL